MISNLQGWHYLARIKFSALLTGLTLKCNRGFYCLNWFQSFRAKAKLKSQKNVCEKKLWYCNAF